MRSCLLDPEQGYYTASHKQAEDPRNVIGAKGDFITSPEISQVFGELLAIFFVARWQSVSMPQRTRLVELGPGRGTLLADMVRTFGTFKRMIDSLKTIHLVETSLGLQRLQEQALREVVEGRAGKKLVVIRSDDEPKEPSEDEVHVQWFADAHSVPIDGSFWTMLVAHEFFDALPVHIFEKASNGFKEVLVDLKNSRNGGQKGISVIKSSEISASTAPSFQYVLSPSATPWSMLLASRNARFASIQPGQRVEVSPDAWSAARRVGELISGREAALPPIPDEARRRTSSVGGVGLIVDYGDEKAFGSSFRAFKQHKIVDPLEDPGTADLTANVDFTHLKHALASTEATAHGPMVQAHFLSALGLQQRVEALLRAASSPERKSDITKAAMRLVDLTSMGKEYKVLGIDALATAAAAAPELEREPSRVPLYPFEMQPQQQTQ
ncbi:DUF185-domain-containing protein [Tilletiaria anomala UBC 951]|uniref:Protein arginine methyltransferase NDUFAF7 n=1 Tax=Tilletiaria anomala (strain ATCC 24038 / CBS 436.72 / UBC 951) TaxID=1037660 RepID=A0A066WCA0_TILAU|nr:DUF185-domain-containing protein [Tilletiaria anomala UBC 951]KDN51336.1 DUF185-domain-containing protein [Tilletiaria anomala UBC 951]